MDAITELMAKLSELSPAVAGMRDAGRELAQAEHDYRVLKAAKVYALREARWPVTIIPDLAKGDGRVAELMLARDLAQTMYDASREHVNVLKLETRVLEAQAEREWSDAGRIR